MEEHTSKPRVAGEQGWSTLSGPMSREPWQGSFPSCPLGSSWGAPTTPQAGLSPARCTAPFHGALSDCGLMNLAEVLNGRRPREISRFSVNLIREIH